MADKKIADLNEATTATDTDILIIQDNANTKKITWANLKTAIIGAFSSILGNRTYTEQNVVTNGESITNSINELDVDLASHKAENVTQIGGVHGLEFESGSNSDGQYFRLGDWQVCIRLATLDLSLPVNTRQSFPMPKSFGGNTKWTGMSPPASVVSGTGYGERANAYKSALVTGEFDTDQWTVVASSTYPDSISIRLIAIGKYR